MTDNKLDDTAKQLVNNGKGILAADESSGTIKKRFDSIGVESTADLRRDYREMMFTAVEAMRNHISGVILFDETIRQKASDGRMLVEKISATGALPGIKVDAGTKDIPFFPGEKITEGLDGLGERLKEYHALGARFAKWRAVIDIGDGIPTDYAIAANADALARYAALCQAANIVPIVEPEVLMDGPVAKHGIETCEIVTERTLTTVFDALKAARVRLEAMILKPNMVVPGKNSGAKASPQQVAERTVRVLKRTVPAAVPGVAFLSGGQSDEEATRHLSLMNAMAPLPWKLTFSYGRALQAAALKAWGGRRENLAAAQAAFAHRARMNGLAASGKWSETLEKAA
jgi:fructose-bisphosphate aldolase class I